MGSHKLIIEGNVGSDPRFTAYESGKVCTSMTVAVGTSDREGEPKTTWYTVDAWGDLAHASRHLRKGARVLVSGEPALVQWKGREGAPRMRIQVRAAVLEELPRPRQGAPHGEVTMRLLDGELVTVVVGLPASKEAAEPLDYVGFDD